MTEINPKYVDGEPVCCSECPHAGTSSAHCKEGIKYDLLVGDPCTPALRRDRDEARATAARFMEEAGKWKRESEKLTRILKGHFK